MRYRSSSFLSPEFNLCRELLIIEQNANKEEEEADREEDDKKAVRLEDGGEGREG